MSEYKWVEWRSRKHGEVIAMAIDEELSERTGVTRAVNGSMIGQDAKPASPDTPKCPICLHIIESRIARAARKEVKAKVKAARKMKAGDKHAAVEKAVKAKAKAKGRDVVMTFEKGNLRGHLERSLKGHVKVIICDRDNPQVFRHVSTISKEKAGANPTLKITEKSWAVYSNKKRVAFGRF